MRLALKTVYTIWLREAKTFVREKFRVVAMIAQPLLYLAVLGNGISSGVTLNASGGINYLTFMYPGVIGMSILFTSIFSAVSIRFNNSSSISAVRRPKLASSMLGDWPDR